MNWRVLVRIRFLNNTIEFILEFHVFLFEFEGKLLTGFFFFIAKKIKTKRRQPWVALGASHDMSFFSRIFVFLKIRMCWDGICTFVLRREQKENLNGFEILT